ncbi:hypothetical protein SAMN06269185_2018 [Natronoarchaeum philippinense]|uniref:Uncharacterized protein n=1 Tax=Natronoarchaeum philippinense TaxID=558529 RepID=A0A285NVH7_NATPI|nr:hypothetical protein [Natronoarchaeum philippinense]SNZ13027.1 hypothetical protein SAMN06269185_2018 [Natronoarchaeum philippinense]
MTSLADVYEGHVGEVRNVRRLYLGTGLFLAGALVTVVGMLVATTGLAGLVGIEREFAPYRYGGLLAGLGVPAIFVGVSTVLPASVRLRAAAGIGASIAVLGVALFWYAYPDHWLDYGQELTAIVVGVYFIGVITTLGCLFVGIANFKERNAPGGTVSMQFTTEEGETRVVEVERSEIRDNGLGGVGMLGGTPDGNVETQTNRPNETRSATRSRSSRSNGSGTSTRGDRGRSSGNGGAFGTASSPASDGGATTADISFPLDEQSGDAAASNADRDLADRYCGNCEHFRYERSSDGMVPYCGYHDAAMDDMDACDQWEPNG